MYGFEHVTAGKVDGGCHLERQLDIGFRGGYQCGALAVASSVEEASVLAASEAVLLAASEEALAEEEAPVFLRKIVDVKVCEIYPAGLEKQV